MSNNDKHARFTQHVIFAANGAYSVNRAPRQSQPFFTPATLIVMFVILGLAVMIVK